jgi:hypothetical protein
MKTKLIATLLLAGSSLFAAPRIRFGVGIGIGLPVAPAAVVVAPPIVDYAPPCPGPGYVWLNGAWVFGGGPAYVGRAFHGPVYHAPVYRGRVYGRDFRRR